MSGGRLFIVSDLPAVGFAKTDDADTIVNGREAQHMQTGLQKAQRDKTRLEISLAVVLLGHGRIEIEIGSTRERKVALFDVLAVLGAVEVNVQS